MMTVSLLAIALVAVWYAGEMRYRRERHAGSRPLSRTRSARRWSNLLDDDALRHEDTYVEYQRKRMRGKTDGDAAR